MPKNTQTNTHTRAQETIVKNDEHGGVIQSGPCGIIDLSTAIMCFRLCKRRAETGREEMNSTHTDKKTETGNHRDDSLFWKGVFFFFRNFSQTAIVSQ